eukprot:TRINITY_DN8817_c0_g1_i1.p1 TRINITY_DN8817_c0_g1~~TRINITY_DN8817_c0_g1_i1.p1  ORF type:complete len:234 (-),score=43.74 TRINITY_DN8817_c0_g1_i1:550-1251(-)
MASALRTDEETGMKKAPVYTSLDTHPQFDRLCIRAGLFSLASGFVNALAIFEFAMTVAHHTGNASHTGRFSGQDGLRFGRLMVAYLFGSALVGYVGWDGVAPMEGRGSGGLITSALITAGAVFYHQATENVAVTLALWAFAQGIQNGVTSKYNILPVRTTHVTGALTDAGLGFGQYFQASGKKPSLKKTWVMLWCIFGFGLGGLLARESRKALGLQAGLIPAALLFILSVGRS